MRGLRIGGTRLTAFQVIAAGFILLILAGEELHLTPNEYKLLCLLTRNCGKVLTHKYITQKIWGAAWENNVASLRVVMATLRKKLEKDPECPPFIQTYIGIGYRMLRVDAAGENAEE